MLVQIGAKDWVGYGFEAAHQGDHGPRGEGETSQVIAGPCHRSQAILGTDTHNEL